MATRNPSLVFLVDAENAGMLRLLCRAADVKLADVVRQACRRALDATGRPMGFCSSQPRDQRIRVHVPPTFKALLQERAAKDGLTLGTWVARALGDHLVANYARYLETAA